MKYVKLFENVADANAQVGGGLDSPHVDVVADKAKTNFIKVNASKFTCTFNSNGTAENIIEPQPNNEIWYTSNDGNVVTGWENACNGSGSSALTIVSNTYSNGKGVVKMSGDINSVVGQPDGMFFNTYLSKNIQTVTIPNSITSINGAFFTCSNLTSINIPDSVTSIGTTTFAGTGLTSITIPAGEIGLYAFSGCDGLISCNIGNSVNYIGDYAFNGCYFAQANFVNNSSCTSSDNWGAAIVDVEQSDGLLIRNNQVVKCRKLATAVIIPNSVTSIGQSAFSGCTGLTSIVIPNSVTSIGSYAFRGCSSLSEVICNSTTPPTLGYMAFDRNASVRLIKVPAQSVNAYKTATNWSEYADSIVAQS